MPLHTSAALMAGVAAFMAPAQTGTHLFHADHVLGTSLDVVLVSASEQMAGLALAAIRAEIARLDAILSGWCDDSELAALNRSARHAASPDLFAVLMAGEAWREKSHGAFSLGAPLVLDQESRTVIRPHGNRLAIDAIAKGYIIDRALAAATAAPGIDGVLLDIGGDLCCRGRAPGKAWRIGVADPGDLADNAPLLATLALNNSAIASSGVGARGHAIRDPRTGAMRDDIAMATAVAPRAADADALATIFHVLPPRESLALADRLPGVAAHIVQCDGTVQMSKGWERLAQATPPRAATSVWPQGFAVKIDYEIPRFTSSLRLYPPYVTIWITNAAGEPVRTLVFHAARERYMRENYVFWEKIGQGNQKLVDAVTRPTRGPGAYSIAWDGRDDNRQPVPQGRYIVNIEAAREHGGHSIQRVEIELGQNPASAAAAADDEMGAVKVTYGKP